MNEQQSDELIALSAIFEDKVSWTVDAALQRVVCRMHVEIDWEEDRQVEVWDSRDLVEGFAEVDASRQTGVERLVEDLGKLEVREVESKSTVQQQRGLEVEPKQGRGKRRRRGGGKAATAPTSPAAPRSAPVLNPQLPRASHPSPRSAATPPSTRSAVVLTLSSSRTNPAPPTLIRLPASPPPTLPAPLPSTIDLLPSKSTAAEPHKLSLRYLPSLEIEAILGAGYPETEAPRIELRDADGWLGEQRLVELQAKLDTVWDHSECLWLLHDLVGGSALLTTLDLTFPLVLRQAASPSFTPLSTSLLAHDAAQKGTHFAAQTFSCPLCLTALKGRHCLTLEACPLPATVGEGKHTFCRACLESYFTLLITEGLVRNVCCPAVECTRERVKWEREEEQGGRDGATRSSRPGEVGRVELLGIVGEEMTARWEALKEKQRLEADPSTSYCPRPTCLTPVSAPPPSDPTNLRLCPSCAYAYCNLCSSVWHGSHTPCVLPRSGAIVRAYLEGTAEEKEQLERKYGKSNVRRLVDVAEEERVNREWLEGRTKACPGCRVKVEKSAGCNHMQCSRCSTHFCFRCAHRLAATDPYTHFSAPGGSCYNRLFDFRAGEEPAVEEWIGDALREEDGQARAMMGQEVQVQEEEVDDGHYYEFPPANPWDW